MRCAADPLGMTLFPLGEGTFRVAELGRERADGPFCAPFGLTRGTTPRMHAIDLGGLVYDPVRQVTVLADGTAFVDAPSMRSTLYCTSLTTEDMQTWTDSVPDGTD